MKWLTVGVTLALVLSVAPAFAGGNDEDGLRFQPGIQLNVFGTGGGPSGKVAWAFGGQGTLFKWGQLSFGGAGISFIHLEHGHAFAPYAELVTINMAEGQNIIGITFKYVFRNAFERAVPGEPLDHGFGVGFVFAGF